MEKIYSEVADSSESPKDSQAQELGLSGGEDFVRLLANNRRLTTELEQSPYRNHPETASNIHILKAKRQAYLEALDALLPKSSKALAIREELISRSIHEPSGESNSSENTQN